MTKKSLFGENNNVVQFLKQISHCDLMVRFVWLSLVGFLKHFGMLCRDRLEYMTLSIRSRFVLVDKDEYNLHVPDVFTCNFLRMF